METIITADKFRKTAMFRTVVKRDARCETTLTIKCIDEITINDNGRLKKRTIRLIDGEPSIYADEQPTINSLQDPKLIDKRIKRIQMKDGMLFVPNFDVNTLTFMRLSNYNRDNELRDNNISALYYEYKPEEYARKSLASEKNRVEAEHKALNMSIEEAKAYLLTIATDPGYVRHLEEKSSDEIRHDIFRVAKMNPDAFVKGLETTAQKNKYHIMRASSLGILNVSRTRITWPDGSLVIEAPVGREAADFLAEKATQDEKYNSVITAIKDKTAVSRIPEEERATNKAVSNDSVDDSNQINVTAELANTNVYNALFAEAKATGVVRFKKFVVMFGDKEWANKFVFIKELEQDDELFNAVRRAVKEVKQSQK